MPYTGVVTMKSAAVFLWIATIATAAFGEIGVEYQGVEAFVQTTGDVRIVYDFLVMGDGTQAYDLLPVTLPREKYDRARLKAYARRESARVIEASEGFDENEWTSIPVQPSRDKDSENDVWVDITGWTPDAERPVRFRLEVWMEKLAALDTICSDTAGVLTGFTSFADPDQSATARWRIHLPPGAALREIVAYRDLGEGKYAPLFPRREGDHAVVEWETRGLPGYYWIYTMFPAGVITSKLSTDWRYMKDSEPRALPLESLEMDVRVEPENVTRMDILFKVENTHSCLPLRSITFHLPDRGTASAVMSGRPLGSKVTGRRKPTYVFHLRDQEVPPGGTAEARIAATFRLMIERIPEDLESVMLRLSPSLYSSEHTQPASRRTVRILLLPGTDLRKVSAGAIPFTGTGTVEGRPYVYWDLAESREVSVKFPRGRLNKFDGPYDLSRPSEWVAVLLEVRGVQFFVITVVVIIALAHRWSRRRSG